MTKVLYIAHHFPPLGGAGVQRTVKFLKYLPGFGILPVVVTGPGISQSKWEVEDETMLAEIPPEVSIFRSSTRRDGAGDSEHFGVTGPRERGLVEAGIRASVKHQFDAIFVSMSPFEDCEVGRVLSERLGIPWIADLRDPWALDEFQIHRSRWHHGREVRRMRESLDTASMIIMNTPVAAQKIEKELPDLAAKVKLISITNGYDADDFSVPVRSRETKSFTIVHAGFMHTSAGLAQQRRRLEYGLLGRTDRGVKILTRSHFYLLKALEMWRREDPGIENDVGLTLVGSTSNVDRELVKNSDVSKLCRYTGYVSHKESLDHVRTADVLFLPLHKMPPGGRASIVPGKTYEYMASGNTILGALPCGDARDFLEAAGSALLCEPDDVASMSRLLQRRYRLWKDGKSGSRENEEVVHRFERRHLASKLSSVILELCGPPSAEPAMEGEP